MTTRGTLITSHGCQLLHTSTIYSELQRKLAKGQPNPAPSYGDYELLKCLTQTPTFEHRRYDNGNSRYASAHTPQRSTKPSGPPMSLLAERTLPAYTADRPQALCSGPAAGIKGCSGILGERGPVWCMQPSASPTPCNLQPHATYWGLLLKLCVQEKRTQIRGG